MTEQIENTMHITRIGNCHTDLYIPFTIRGWRKGDRAKPCKCSECGETIEIGEQYFRIDGYLKICLGCAEFV